MFLPNSVMFHTSMRLILNFQNKFRKNFGHKNNKHIQRNFFHDILIHMAMMLTKNLDHELVILQIKKSNEKWLIQEL